MKIMSIVIKFTVNKLNVAITAIPTKLQQYPQKHPYKLQHYNKPHVYNPFNAN